MATSTPKHTPKAEPPATSPYTVLGNLDHDGQRYTAGQPVLLTAADAAPLLAAGVVAEPAD